MWQELGTDRIPPRSFLGGATVRKLPEIQHILGASVYAALTGEKVVDGAMKLTD